MKKTLYLLLITFFVFTIPAGAKKKTVMSDRQWWAGQAYKMAQPVLENMAKGELQKNMQMEFSPSFDNRNRKVAYMECFGRLMAGIAPWLALPDDNTEEGKMRKQLREWALQSYKNAVDPKCRDYLCWGIGGQNLVDAAYIAESFLRAYDALWMPLDKQTKEEYFKEFKKLRKIDPPAGTTTNTVSTPPSVRWRNGTPVTDGTATDLTSPLTITAAMSSILCISKRCRLW